MAESGLLRFQDANDSGNTSLTQLAVWLGLDVFIDYKNHSQQEAEATIWLDFKEFYKNVQQFHLLH